MRLEAALDKEGHKEGTSVWASWLDYGVSKHRETQTNFT